MSIHIRTNTSANSAANTSANSAVNTTLDATVSTQTLSERVTWQLAIVLLFLFAFCLGFPQFHYTAALMIAVILRYKDTPGDIFAPAFG